MEEKSQSRAIALALAAVVLWSTVATAFKLSLAYQSPLQLVFFASLTSVMVLSLWVSVKKRWGELIQAFGKRPGYYLLLGFINPFLYYLVLFKAYALLPAQQAQALNYTWALALALLSVPLLGQRLSRTDLLACTLGYSGALVIATGGTGLSLQFQSPLGVALALGSTLLWTLYWLYNTRNQDHPVVSLLLCFLCALPFILAGNLYEWFYYGQRLALDWPALAGAAYIGLFEMGITFVLWLKALKQATHIARISNLIFMSPFLSLIFIALVLDEPVAPSTLTGLVIIVGAVLLQKRQKSEKIPVEKETAKETTAETINNPGYPKAKASPLMENRTGSI